MNREIKFRGKDIGCNKWRYGSLVKVRENDGTLLYYIVDEENQQWIVFPETVGQYTGFYDMDDRKIFERDIVEENELLYIVIWDEYECAYNLKSLKTEMLYGLYNAKKKNKDSSIKVIGNEIDNFELLEVSQ